MHENNSRINEILEEIKDLKKQLPAHSIPRSLIEKIDDLEEELEKEKMKVDVHLPDDRAFQDYYPDQWSHCYGCGSLNEHGHQLKTYWDSEGKHTISEFTPREYHTAIPGYVYGGLIASLIDCHGTGSASAAAYRNENRRMDSQPPMRFLTASLQVNYLKPTPLGEPLLLKGTIKEISGRKVVVNVDVIASDLVTAKGEVIAVLVPEHLVKQFETS